MDVYDNGVYLPSNFVAFDKNVTLDMGTHTTYVTITADNTKVLFHPDCLYVSGRLREEAEALYRLIVGDDEFGNLSTESKTVWARKASELKKVFCG